MQAYIRAAQIRLACPDLDASLRFYTEKLGFRVELVMPADGPSLAVVSGHGLTLRLEAGEPSPAPAVLHLLCDMKTLPANMARELTAPEGTRVSLAEANPPVELPPMHQEFVLVRLGDGDSGWGLGRAGMAYRDLIPGRLGGRFVASQIRIRDGGPVPDWVHFHRIRFQMIYCLKGWARLVYEDQGEPFLLNEGDCVLQPPEIRHRVLESSAGLEVIEIGSPAVHETFADHALDLPNAAHRPDRRFAGQRFARHIAASAVWSPWRLDAYEARDTGIAAATDGLASVRVVRPVAGRHGSGPVTVHQGEFLFFFVLNGALGLESSVFGSHRLASGDCCVIPAGAAYALTSEPGLEMLEVMLPAG
jgi:mannose-6-phosphate isomerase-like protein (cupin superfamily)